MYWRGHVGAALLAFAPAGTLLLIRGSWPLAVTGWLVAVGIATVPDTDERLPIPHRGPTHTIWFAGLLGALAFGTGWLVGSVLGVQAMTLGTVTGVAATVSLLSHLAADVVTPMGIRPWKPISDRHYSLGLTPARNPRANRFLLGAGGAAVLVGYWIASLL